MKISAGFRTARLLLLLWAAMILSAQSLSVAHEHVDEAAGTHCVVCPLAKAQTAAWGALVRVPAPIHRLWTVIGHDPARRGETAVASYRSRAPPAT